MSQQGANLQVPGAGLEPAHYAFLAYKEFDDGVNSRVRIQSSISAGAVFEPAAIYHEARAAEALCLRCFTWGFQLVPTPNDALCIEFLTHVSNGLTVEVEMVVQMGRFDGTAARAHTASFAWPA